jgi:predicted amidophosphoribosyltransferase
MSNRDASPERLGKCAECKKPRKTGELFICADCRKQFDPCGKCWLEHAADAACLGKQKATVKADFLYLLEERAGELDLAPDYYIKVLRRDLSILE